MKLYSPEITGHISNNDGYYDCIGLFTFLLELCALLPYNYSYVCMFLVLDLCTYSTNKHDHNYKDLFANASQVRA